MEIKKLKKVAFSHNNSVYLGWIIGEKLVDKRHAVFLITTDTKYPITNWIEKDAHKIVEVS